ncbi:MAG: hypothetical protein LHW45_09460 [Candidatus Cloacimonetes bacterium]|nr:hypothetical protein [Candidatus Cloacimonadota bacterium]MDY0367837.1 hypothetical protein [Candidatus Syntrophosphaera sp.]
MDNYKVDPGKLDNLVLRKGLLECFSKRDNNAGGADHKQKLGSGGGGVRSAGCRSRERTKRSLEMLRYSRRQVRPHVVPEGRAAELEQIA